MKRIIYLLFAITIILALYGCPEIDKNTNEIEIFYINRSNKDIYVCSKIVYDMEACPDTTLPKQKTGKIVKRNDVRYTSFAPPTCDTMRFFILSLDTVEKYDWETIRKEYKILKRYDVVGEKGLDQIGGVITYP